MARHATVRGERGQMIVLFALASTVIILAVGLVIDGGYAFSQRRELQNASNTLPHSPGACVVAEWVGQDTVNGTDANVRDAIANSILANGGPPITFGPPNVPIYVTSGGSANGFVGDDDGGGYPGGHSRCQRDFEPELDALFLGLIGVDNWTATTVATAKGGYSLAGPPGNVFRRVSQATYETWPLCAGDVNSSAACQPVAPYPGEPKRCRRVLWVEFGAAGKCTGFGLGMINDRRDNSKPFLQSEIGPPANSYGCCTAVTKGVPPTDRIGSLPGNKVSADCSYYIDNTIQVTVPVWDVAGGQGANGWYHIVGFAGMQLTACNGGKDVEGVLRQLIFPGPTTTSPQPKGHGTGRSASSLRSGVDCFSQSTGDAGSGACH